MGECYCGLRRFRCPRRCRQASRTATGQTPARLSQQLRRNGGQQQASASVNRVSRTSCMRRSPLRPRLSCRSMPTRRASTGARPGQRAAAPRPSRAARPAIRCSSPPHSRAVTCRPNCCAPKRQREGMRPTSLIACPKRWPIVHCSDRGGQDRGGNGASRGMRGRSGERARPLLRRREFRPMAAVRPGRCCATASFPAARCSPPLMRA